MTEEKRPQAVFHKDTPVKVTFSPRAYTKRDPEDGESEEKFHKVFVDYLDGSGKTECGEAYLTEGDFDIDIYVTQSTQPYAFQVLHAAERQFGTRNVRIRYYD